MYTTSQVSHECILREYVLHCIAAIVYQVQTSRTGAVYRIKYSFARGTIPAAIPRSKLVLVGTSIVRSALPVCVFYLLFCISTWHQVQPTKTMPSTSNDMPVDIYHIPVLEYAAVEDRDVEPRPYGRKYHT